MDGFAWLFACSSPASAPGGALCPLLHVAQDDPVPRFFAFLLAFMGAMLGIVLSGNLIQLAFFWELTSLCPSC
jgi:multicomponent K+:H+ antiporter subunit A